MLRPLLAGVMVALIAVVAPAAASAGSGSGKLTISPAPDTPDVNPQTQISILGVAPGKIRSVEVNGESSGPHTGSLEPYSGKRGASFVLDQPLTQGEQASTVVRIKGRDPIEFSFTVAHLGPAQPPLNLTATQPDKLDHFVSEPNLTPPKITVNKTTSKTRNDGPVMLTPLPSPVVHPESNNAITIKPVGPGGTMIVDRKGRPLWFNQLKQPAVAANLRIQRYKGKKMLTWWQGTVTPSAFGVGEGVIANHSYRPIATVDAGNGYPMDIHEFELTPQGDALFTIYSPILVHLPGTPEGTLSPLLDAIVQEVDIKTGLVDWEWHSYGHIPLSESHATPSNSASYDAFHINSIQDLANGRVLISARDTSAIYKIDQASGRILWRLGGTASDFKMGSGATFNFQHDAHMLPGGKISLFDDEAGPPQLAPSSRGLVLKLKRHPRKAKVSRQYHRSNDTSAQSEGSVQTLGGGNVFVGWGSTPFFSQFSRRGKLLWDASLPQDDGSYRVYSFPWSATPKTNPAVAAQRNGSGTSVFASWNGATKVARWRVLAGDDANTLEPIQTAKRTSFETQINVTGEAAQYAVQALGSNGRVLGQSDPVPAS